MYHPQSARDSGESVTRPRADSVEIRLDTAEEQLVIINKRPGLDAFLHDASQKFNLFAFTASESFYCNPLLDRIDKSSVFKKRFSRSDCTRLGENVFTKDLTKVMSRMRDTDGGCGEASGAFNIGCAANWAESFFKRTVLVDNNPFSFVPQPRNGIPVVSWYSDLRDNALQKVIEFLDGIDKLEDVRPFLDQQFHVDATLKQFQAMQQGDGTAHGVLQAAC
jgi:CTD small phosphatase-like protein 2